VEIYIARSKEENVAPPPSVSTFRIHRFTSTLSQPLSTVLDLPNVPSINNGTHEMDFFTEDSSFADYFGVLPRDPPVATITSSSLSIDIPVHDENANSHHTSPEKLIVPTRRPLSVLMQDRQPLSLNNSSNNFIRNENSVNSYKTSDDEHEQAQSKNQSNLGSPLSHDGLSVVSGSDSQQDAIYMDESINLEGVEPPEDGISDHQRSIHRPASHMDDYDASEPSNMEMTDANDQMQDEGANELPTIFDSRSSLAKSLAASRTLEIIEDERAVLSFDDHMDEDMTYEPSRTTSNRSSSIKKRKRANDMRADGMIDSDDEKHNGGTTKSQSRTTGERKRPKTLAIESLLEDSNPDGSMAFGGSGNGTKRQNFRKLNLKNGYKKPKMDREAMSLARTRKIAMDLSRSLGPEITPFDMIDESTMDLILDTNSNPAVAVAAVSPQTNIQISSSLQIMHRIMLESIQQRQQPQQQNHLIHQLPQDLMLQILKEHCNTPSFRVGQEEAILRVLQGLPTLLILPTGGGKSLCYQFPSLCFPDGITLVVSPLLSLIDDQIRNLPRSLVGISLNSKMSTTETKHSLELLRTGKATVLFVSPEKLASKGFLELFEELAITVNLVCVDEAHCISTWSHNFRPTYLSIFKHAVQVLRAKCVLALTATATPATATSICDLLHIPREGVLRYHPVGEHLALNVSVVLEKHDKLESILKLPQLSSSGSVIVYVMFQRQADELASYLVHKGWSAAAYHAGKTPNERKRVQTLFLTNKVRILIATVAFGMGIDHKEVCGVIHFGMPKSVENYVQEIGRAGRSGSAAYCHMLIHPLDIHTLRSLAHSDTQDRAAVKGLMLALFDEKHLACPSGKELRFGVLRITESERQFDMKQSMISTIITWLVNDERIILLPQTSATCEIACLGKSMDYLKNQSKLLAQCYKIGKKLKGVTSIALEVLAKERSQTLDSVLHQLAEVAKTHDLSLSFKDPAVHYQIIDGEDEWDLDQAIDEIVAKIKHLERVSLEKIDAMFRLATLDSEKTMHERIREYFGAENDSLLKSSESIPLSSSTISTPSYPINLTQSLVGSKIPYSSNSTNALIAADVKVFISLYGESISTARQIARIFHGLASPQFPKEEWERNRFWGKSVSTPFEIIQSIAQEQLIAAVNASFH
jgi:ATP-dependent DNA helicase Q4